MTAAITKIVANTLAFIEFHGSQCCLGWCSPIQRQTQIQKSCLRAISEAAQIKVWSSSFKWWTKNTTFVDFAFYMGFPDLIWVTSSAENIYLATKRKVGPKWEFENYSSLQVHCPWHVKLNNKRTTSPSDWCQLILWCQLIFSMFIDIFFLKKRTIFWRNLSVLYWLINCYPMFSFLKRWSFFIECNTSVGVEL